MSFFSRKKSMNRQDMEREQSFPLNKSADLRHLLERVGDIHHVLLGEASHGTHEYYTWRTEITKKLIVDKVLTLLL